MILDLDIGNSRCKWRLEGANRSVQRSGSCALEQLWQLGSACLHSCTPQRIRVSSVRGASVDDMIREWGIREFGVAAEFAVAESFRAGVINAYAEPGRLGVDRWLAMLAAYRDVQAGVCVIDCGSAITVDLVDNQGAHRGGYIAPGLRLMRDSLMQGTDNVRFTTITPQIDTRPGRCTEQAVAAGTMMAAMGVVKQAIGACRAICENADAIFTGGDGAMVRDALKEPSRFQADLVLAGLAIALP